jgi:CRP/FNR family cyclic AMP-dependent transcriptional regulator
VDLAVLKAIPLFRDLTADELALIGQYVSEVSVSQGKHLVDEGDYAYEFFVIEDGEAEVTRSGERLAVLKAGDFFGETGLLEKQQRNASVVALSPMRLLTLSHWDMNRLRKRLPSLAEHMRRTSEKRLAETPTT